jgi:hypothetical protein
MQLYPPHSMILIKKEGEEYSLSYFRYEGLDTQQFVKYGLESWEIAQLFGGN